MAHARPALLAVLILAATLIVLPACATQVLVRPLPGTQPKDVSALREKLQVNEGRYEVPRMGAWLWISKLSPEQADSVMRDYGKQFTYEVVRGDYRELVSPASERELPELASRNLAKVKSRPYVSRYWIVKMRSPEFASRLMRRGLPPDTTLIPEYASMIFRFSPDLFFSATRIGYTRHDKDGNRFAWVGDLDVKRRPAVVKRYQGGFGAGTYWDGHVYARFERQGVIYQLIPLGNQYHVAVQVNAAAVAEDYDRVEPGDTGGTEPDLPSGGVCMPQSNDRVEPSDTGGLEPDKVEPSDTGGTEPDQLGLCVFPCGCAPVLTVRGDRCDEGPRSNAIIRLGVAYTKEAKDELPDIVQATQLTTGMTVAPRPDHFAQYLVDLTAASFVRSGISARVQLAGVQTFGTIDPAAAMADRLLNDLLSASPTPKSSDIQQWRNQIGADIVVVISTLDRSSEVNFTIAGVSPPKRFAPPPESGYSVVVAKYADAQLSFLHELGHHLGASHDIGPPLYLIGRGLRNGCTWRTIMAYGAQNRAECPAGVPRYAIWSSCNLLLDNVPAGSFDRNNVRVINHRANWISGYKP